jgi:hypothetical protein
VTHFTTDHNIHLVLPVPLYPKSDPGDSNFKIYFTSIFLLISYKHFCIDTLSPSQGKDKGIVVPVLLNQHRPMRAYWGNGGTAPLIL